MKTKKTETLELILGVITGILVGFNILLILFAPAHRNTVSDLLSNFQQIKFYIVSSGSMEPAIPVGSAILTLPSKNYSAQDIVTFKLNGDKKTVITHRITSLSDGLFQTKGDANKTPDSWKVSPDSILGKVAISVPYIGYLINFAKMPYGFILLIIIPATIIIYEELRSIKKEASKIFKNLFSRKGLAIETEKSVPFFKILSILPIIAATFLFVAMSGSFFLDSEQSINNILTAAATFPQTSPTPTPTPTPTPGAPLCPNVDAPVKVFYPIGLHWIVGNPVLQMGSDRVFNLGEDKYAQCFCPVSGTEGTQTDWMPVGSFIQPQIDSFISQGWIFVQNGADFDLASQPYLAKNSSFACSQP